MAMKEMKPIPVLCTYCGNPATPVTRDHPIPRALWAIPSNERSPTVASCRTCNNHSNESILKHFFIVFDSRFHRETISHFQKPGGEGDFLKFREMSAEVGGNRYLYPNESVTAGFVKMFTGIRRHLMHESWFFVPPEQFLLFKLDKRDGHYESWRLPLRAGVANTVRQLGQEFAEVLDKPMQYKFRDFSYEIAADDDGGMVMGLRYEREEFAGLGNRLYLICFVLKMRSATTTQSTPEG